MSGLRTKAPSATDIFIGRGIIDMGGEVSAVEVVSRAGWNDAIFASTELNAQKTINPQKDEIKKCKLI